MRFEPPLAFTSSGTAPLGGDPPPVPGDSTVARELAFLTDYGVERGVLAAAATRAQRDDVCPARGLIAYDGVSENLFYRGLAHHLGVGFEAGWPQIAAPVDVVKIQRRGFTKLACGRWLIAPSDNALRLLMAARERFCLNQSRLVLTTPAHLAALARHRGTAAIAYAASHALPDMAPHLSAKDAFDRRACGITLVLGLVCGLATLFSATAFLVAMGLLFFAGMVFRLLVCANGQDADPATNVTLRDDEAPFYSVLVPLYREANMVPHLIAALDLLDYPRSKLEILVLVETDDVATRSALSEIALSSPYRVLVVPDGKPRTKPRALNVGLMMARGTLVTVYDAEDRPAPDQLRRAAQRFDGAPAHLACLQARLRIMNGGRSRLARAFAIEYASLFELFNVGLARWRLPIPLGGTSNHFRVASLRAIGGWDAWNVTEDADLGLRLARFGYETDVLDSVTCEDALESPALWFRQRRRWMKGWFQTLLVLARDARSVSRDLGPRRAMSVGLCLLNLVVGPLLTPLFLSLVILHLIWEGMPTPHANGTLLEATLSYSVIATGAELDALVRVCGLEACRPKRTSMELATPVALSADDQRRRGRGPVRSLPQAISLAQDRASTLGRAKPQPACPSRSPWYTPALMRPHQSGLSRYQRTVLRSPVSKLSSGTQPRSRLIFEASMA